MKEEKAYVIEVDLTKKFYMFAIVLLAGITMVLSFFVFIDLSSASSNDSSVSLSGAKRQFYLTEQRYLGNEVLDVCAAGYHFASIWEILDPSNLIYNKTLGITDSDSGDGPPKFEGWVRTGGSAMTVSSLGRSNCNGWQSRGFDGTTVELVEIWDTDYQDIGVWDANLKDCNTYGRVWCIED